MPKTIKNCFYEKLTFQKLMEAHSRARKHKTYKNEVIKEAHIKQLKKCKNNFAYIKGITEISGF